MLSYAARRVVLLVPVLLGATVVVFAGLGYLRQRGCPTVLLYSDDDNVVAMRLYERAGFHRHDVDIRYLRRAGSPIRNRDV